MTAQDFNELILYLQNSPPEKQCTICPDWKEFANDPSSSSATLNGGERLREKVLKELNDNFAKEKKTSVSKIQAQLDKYPALKQFFMSNHFWSTVDDRMDKEVLLKRFRQNPEIMFGLPSSSSSEESADS